MALKAADLGHLTSSTDVHKQWVARLEEVRTWVVEVVEVQGEVKKEGGSMWGRGAASSTDLHKQWVARLVEVRVAGTEVGELQGEVRWRGGWGGGQGYSGRGGKPRGYLGSVFKRGCAGILLWTACPCTNPAGALHLTHPHSFPHL